LDFGGSVAEDLREALRPSSVVLERTQEAITPEATLVLSHMPSLVLGAAFGYGLARFFRGVTLLAIFGREDHVRRLASNLLFRPAHEALGSPVPRGDSPLEVGRDDRITLGTFDE
jgi:hypothetical protein